MTLFFPILLSAATGKIRGTVTDHETGEPLALANVVIDGTRLGAATDRNGEFIILNVPTGKYTLICTYMGYQKVTVQEVIVNSGLTTFKDFELPRSVVEMEGMVIVAERPLIDKNETNEIHTMRSEDLDQMPIRGITQAITAMAGVIEDDGIHVRGGRSDEVAYYIDGVNTSNTFVGEQMVTVIHSAIEEVQMQTGGFTAEYGGKMSGITVTTMKTGGPKYNIMAEVISDDFWSIENDAGEHRILGIKGLYSFGYNTYTLTAGGPVIPAYKDLRFFVAVENWNRTSQATWFEGFHQDSIKAMSVTTDNHMQRYFDTLDVYIDQPPGRLPGGGDWGLTLNGNLVWDINKIRFKAGGTWATSRSTAQTAYPNRILTIDRRWLESHPYSYDFYGNITHTITPRIFYTLSASYTRRGSENGDVRSPWPRRWEPWPDAPAGSQWEYCPELMQWGDPYYNSGMADTGMTWSPFQLIFDPSFQIGHDAKNDSFAAGYPIYWKQMEEKYTGKYNLTMQLGKRHELRIGGEYSQGVYRLYWFAGESYLWQMSHVLLDPESYSEYDIYRPLCSLLGYDWQGNPIDEDMIVTTKEGLPEPVSVNIRNAPARPKYGGFYIQDKIELRDIIINAGLRYDYINTGHPSWSSLDSLTMGPGGVIGEEHWQKPRVYQYVSPRVGFSFPVTDQAVFHAQYGRYIQPPDLNYSWASVSYTDILYIMYSGVAYWMLPNPNLMPEKTTSYELGFQMQFGAAASLDVTAFYKDTKDLIALRSVIPLTPDYKTMSFYMNKDFGTIKGVSATFNLRRTSRIRCQLNYTYSHAQGTGSAADTHFNIAWQEDFPTFPRVISSLDYDQRHKGTIDLDARTLPEDGPRVLGFYPLGNVGLNLKFDFHSGSPYTRTPVGDAYSNVYGYGSSYPLESPNASTLPWFFQLDGKLDRTFLIGPLKLNLYLWAINLLGSKCIISGHSQTGRPDSDGWLQTSAGKERIQDIKDTYGPEYGEYYVNWYNAFLTQCGTWGYQAPRQIRFGLKLEI